MKKRFYFLMFLPIIAIANPKPFGLEINKSNIKELKSMYTVTDAGVNKYSGGKMYHINTKELQFDGLNNALAIYSKDEKLLAIILTLHKNKFDNVFKSLKSKYKLIDKKIPFVGDKKAKFINNTTEITLEAPHMSFKMNLNYINKNLWREYKKISKIEKKEKEKREISQL